MFLNLQYFSCIHHTLGSLKPPMIFHFESLIRDLFYNVSLIFYCGESSYQFYKKVHSTFDFSCTIRVFSRLENNKGSKNILLLSAQSKLCHRLKSLYNYFFLHYFRTYF